MSADSFEPLPPGLIQRIMAGEYIPTDRPEPDPYQAGSSGALTEEMLRRALDDLFATGTSPRTSPAQEEWKP